MDYKEKWEDVCFEVEYYWKKVRGFYWDIKGGIRNFWVWRKVIWNDAQFDHSYLYEILKFKLTLMEESFSGPNAWGLNSKNDAKQMRIAIMLLDRILADEYHERAFKEHEKKWGDLEMWTTPCVNKSYSECSIRRTKVCTPEEIQKENKESLRLYKHERYMQKQDINYLFKHIAKHIERWWD